MLGMVVVDRECASRERAAVRRHVEILTSELGRRHDDRHDDSRRNPNAGPRDNSRLTSDLYLVTLRRGPSGGDRFGMGEKDGMRQTRVVLVLILLLGVVATGQEAIAQSAGSELAEEVAVEAVGDGAYVVLESVEAFPVEGGEAVFEPGTAYEEPFTYAAVDADTNRLVGLTRPAPIAHSAGAFVQAPETNGSSGAEATPTPTSSPSEQAGSASPDASSFQDGDGDQTTSNGVADEASSDNAPDPCYVVADRGCTDVLGPIVGDPCDAPTACEALNDAATGDPVDDLCDPNNTGQTCADWLSILVGDPIDELCDPGDVGQTCAEWLAAFAFVQEVPCIGETCDVIANPLGRGASATSRTPGRRAPTPTTWSTKHGRWTTHCRISNALRP